MVSSNDTGLIGHPVAHSLSPMIHAHWRTLYHIEGAYDAMDVPPEMLAQRISELCAKNMRGANVTVPHKQAVMAYIDEMDDAARAIGAVNTIIFDGEKSLGKNTDAAGWWASMEHAVPSIAQQLQSVVVIGAGGAARAIVYALVQASATQITLVNRTLESAQNLADEYGVVARPWEQREAALGGVSLLINTTSLGMVDKPALELSLDALPAYAVVNDIVYAPLHTPLLIAALARDNVIVDGIGMLMHQAALSFEYWHGVRPEVDDLLREKLLRELMRREAVCV